MGRSAKVEATVADIKYLCETPCDHGNKPGATQLLADQANTGTAIHGEHTHVTVFKAMSLQ